MALFSFAGKRLLGSVTPPRLERGIPGLEGRCLDPVGLWGQYAVDPEGYDPPSVAYQATALPIEL